MCTGSKIRGISTVLRLHIYIYIYILHLNKMTIILEEIAILFSICVNGDMSGSTFIVIRNELNESNSNSGQS